jgi:cytochrome c oxidase assembly protein subunit 11
MEAPEPIRRSNRSLTLRLAALAMAMFGFGYLLVPLYYLLCDITGIGGRTAETVAAAPVASETARSVKVEFVASVNEYAPWEFRPEVGTLDVRPGRLYVAKFHARNLSDRPLTGQAIPSVAPGQSAKFFKKTDCFCFREQEFAPSESRELVVQFYLDPALPDYVDRLTLSYTMFVKPRDEAATASNAVAPATRS